MTATISFDQEEFASRFPRRPFSTRHTLAGHELVQLPALIDLARRLDADRIEANTGKVKANQRPEEMKMLDLPPDEAIRRIEHEDAWLVLKNVERVPEYRQLLVDVLGHVARAQGYASFDEAGMFDIRGFIFVASANTATPFHIDYEQNFFIHLHGDKEMHIFDNEDRSILSEAELEISPAEHRNLPYRGEYEEKATVYRFKPGEGVFLPFAWPHWVRTGNGYSISMQITFLRREDRRKIKLLSANALLRRAGLPQPAPGTAPWLDGLKVAAYTVLRALIDPLRGSQRINGLLVKLMARRRRGDYFEAEGKA